ncbi:ferritin-like domain-containing protein [Paraburkholderia fungorum]|uniref:ferritin-like domain-containing protein n=1 Tax=Paraburkholderia fungorum TaxID=134537 RepID=UPI0031E91379
MDAFDHRIERRLQRRQFFRNAGALGLGLVGGTLISACGGGSGSIASAQSAPTDPEILNFALNPEYLESQFYTYATTGLGPPASMTTGARPQSPQWPARSPCWCSILFCYCKSPAFCCSRCVLWRHAEQLFA